MSSSGAGTAAAVVEELSVFMPAYDEEANLERTVDEVVVALDRLPGLRRFELIIVDDGSRDRTGTIADALAGADDRVRVVHHPVNRGYGAALKSGFTAARLEWVFWTDSDGQFDVQELPRLTALADRYDLVAGYRVERSDHVVRKVNAELWRWLVRLTLGLRVHDVDCAFKLLRRSWLDKIGPLDSDGAVISTELLVKLRLAGATMTEVGVSHRPRLAGEPSGADVRVILRAFRELWRMRAAMAKARLREQEQNARPGATAAERVVPPPRS